MDSQSRIRTGTGGRNGGNSDAEWALGSLARNHPCVRHSVLYLLLQTPEAVLSKILMLNDIFHVYARFPFQRYKISRASPYDFSLNKESAKYDR